MDAMGSRQFFGERRFVAGIFGAAVIRERRDAVVARELFQDVEGTDFPAGIDREQLAGFDPKDSHVSAATERWATLILAPRVLPADSFVGYCGFQPAIFFKVDQVNDNLPGTQFGLQFITLYAASADHDHLSVYEDFIEGLAQQRSNVRNDLFDVLPVRADQAAKRNIVIPNL